jgi:DNA-binding GntR family transcriptional regulator
MKQTKTTLSKIDQAPQTLRDIVQQRMREAIIAGHFEPGERLVERPLCEQLGVSRTVVRETIRYLEAEGLVELLPNRGPIVAVMDWNQARQIYDIRKQLESSAAAACAKKHTKATAAQLTQALHNIEVAFKDEAPTALFNATTKFYGVIFEQAGHDIAWEIVQRLNGRISRLRVLTLSTQDRSRPGFAHMKEICESILAGDPRAAKRAVKAHIADASEVARRLLDDQDQKQSETG